MMDYGCQLASSPAATPPLSFTITFCDSFIVRLMKMLMSLPITLLIHPVRVS